MLVTNRFIYFYTIPNHWQCRTQAVQLRQIPFSSRLLWMQSRTHFAWSRPIVLLHVKPREPRTCWKYRTRADTHTALGILLAGSRESASVSHVPGIISSCRGHSWCWVITTGLRPYVTDSGWWRRSRARHAIAIRYRASRANPFSNNIFYRLYRSRRRTEGVFLQIYWKGFHQYGWKQNSRWDIQSRYRTVDAV